MWQNKDMKERFWFAYYWLMVSYLVFALVTIVEYQNKYELYEPTSATTGETCAEFNNRINRLNKQRRESGEFGTVLNFWDCVPGETKKRYLNVSNVYEFSNRVLFFNFIEDSTYSRKVDNYYPFILVFLMTLIRFIFIGKHIWQRP